MDIYGYTGHDAPVLYTKIVNCLTEYAQTYPYLHIIKATERIPNPENAQNLRSYILSYKKNVLGTEMPEVQIEVILKTPSVCVTYFEPKTSKAIFLDLKQDIICKHFSEFLPVWLEALDYSTSRHDFESFTEFMEWFVNQTFRQKETRCRNAIKKLTHVIIQRERATALAMGLHPRLTSPDSLFIDIPPELWHLINRFAHS